MDPATLIGIVAALGAVIAAMLMEGSSPAALILPAPLILVFVGTFGAAIAGLAMSDVKLLVSWFKMALIPKKVPPLSENIATLVSLAEKARREGLLALETDAKEVENPFLQRGLAMSIDGTDPDEVRAILESEIQSKKAQDKAGAKVFTDMGGYAPTIGIIGTVIGLIHVLENLDDPDKLGPLIASAFVATLWGVLSANLFWLPMGKTIARISELEAASMELLVEGIAEIQAGTGPRSVKAKLSSLLPPGEVEQEAA